MNQAPKDPRENEQNKAEDALHTEDVRQHIEDVVRNQQDSLSALRSQFDLQTDKNLDALRQTAAGQGYQLITQNIGTVKKVGDGVAIVSGLKGVMENELVVFDAHAETSRNLPGDQNFLAQHLQISFGKPSANNSARVW